jgi:hypothetical protein
MKITDIKKFFTKNLLIAALVVVSAVGIYTSCNNRSKLLLTKSDLATVQRLNTYVNKERHRLDSLTVVLNVAIKERDGVIAIKDKTIVKQSIMIATLTDSLKNTLVKLDSVTADSSYRYINSRIKPVAELKYPFDSIQVKKIHYVFLERDGLFDIDLQKTDLIDNLNMLSNIKDDQIKDLRSLNGVYLSKNSILNDELKSKSIEITGLKKNNRQQKTLKTISNGTVLGLATYIIVHSLIGK